MGSERGITLLIGFLFPGGGQIYQGYIKRGLILLVLITLGYFLLIPGLILHVYALWDADNKV